MKKLILILLFIIPFVLLAQTEPSILSDSDTKAWYVAERQYMTFSSGNIVERWDDKSGNNHYLWQPTPGEQYLPTFSGDTVNFHDNSQFEDLNFTQSQPLTVYLVAKMRSYGGGYHEIIEFNRLDVVLTSDADPLPWKIRSYPMSGLTASSTNRLPKNEFVVLTATFNGTSSSIRINDNTADTGGDLSIDTVARRMIVSHAGMDMAVKEIVVRGVDDTNGDENTIIEWFMQKYDIGNSGDSGDIGGDYYVATDGSDSNPGTYAAPFATLQKAILVSVPGDTTYIRGGIYHSTGRTTINPEKYGGGLGVTGTRANPICYFGYPGEWPILDCTLHCDDPEASYNAAIVIEYVEHIHFKDFEIRNVFQCDSTMNGAIAANYSRNLTFEHIVMHDIGQRGYWMMSGAWLTHYEDGDTDQYPYWDTPEDTTSFINCDVYNLMDSLSSTPGNAADGWKLVFYRGGVYTWDGCRIWNYTDDGIDPSGVNGGTSYIKNCWVMPGHKYPDEGDWGFERNGFKIGRPGWGGPFPDSFHAAEITNSIVFGASHAFYLLESTTGNRTNAVMYNNLAYMCNTSYASTGWGKATSPPTATFRNNVVYESTGYPAGVSIPCDAGIFYPESHNTWDADDNYLGGYITDTVTVTSADFINADSATVVTQLTAARKADGSLPDLTALHLISTSDLIDAGTDVGLPFTGTAPDIGAFEYNSNSGSDNLFPSIKITSPTSGSTFNEQDANILIEVDASDPDGSISKVEFYYDDTNKIGESNSEPWSFSWNDAPYGSYSIRAVATDDEDAKTTSARVYITKEESRKLEITNYSPNPTTDVVTVVFYSPQANSVAITVVNSSGSQVMSMNHSAIIGENNQVDVDLTGLAAGVYTINLNDGSSSDACSVTKQDQAAGSPPVANAGQDQTVNDADNSGNEDITLEGSGSSDSNGTIVSYSWKEGSTEIATGVNPAVSLNVGTHSIALTVTDNEGNTASDNVIIEVAEYVSTRTLEIINSTSSTYDFFTVSFYSPEATTISIEFFNSSGSKVKDASYSAVSENNETSIDISNLPASEYRVTLYDGSTSESCYVTKQDREEPISFEIIKSSPNPTVDLFAVEFTCPQDMMIPVTVFDDASRVVLNEEHSARKGLNKVVLNLSSLQAGNYRIVLSDGNSEISTTVSKQQYFQE